VAGGRTLLVASREDGQRAISPGAGLVWMG
jgi:hypothetical protein